MRFLKTVLFFIQLFYVQGDEELKRPDKGFGDDIKWIQWDDTLSTAKLLNKPVFLLIHKSWCGACQALRNEFKNSRQRDELVELSEKFVMVNTEDDEEPEDERYAPDGRYIPRLFFLDTNGDVLKGMENTNYPDNKHYFPRIPEIIEKMKLALGVFGKSDQSNGVVTNKHQQKSMDNRRDENVKKKSKVDRITKESPEGEGSKDATKRKNEL
uniref:Thioredoxin domain-containing protein n=1 Tax=Setaria digitata TaxID=48799 RepID=A0A915PGC1_9BILA